MKPFAPLTARSTRPARKQVAGFAIATVLLALVLVRMPVVISDAPDIYYRSLLYETLRLGHTWGEALITTDGPLAALQTPTYAGGSIWMAVSWQIAGNLLLAVALTAAAFQLSWPRRCWALGLLAAVLARVPAIAPWLVILMLGWGLIQSRLSPVRSILIYSGLLGFLSLFSLGHLLLAGCTIGLTTLTPRARNVKLAAVIGFTGTLLAAWIALGQPIHGLWLWLGRGLPLLYKTSSLLRRPEALVPTAKWFVACMAGLTIALAFFIRTVGRREGAATGLFLAAAGLLAWKTIALQPFGVPGTFFSTCIFAGFLLLHPGKNPAVPVSLAVTAFAGLVCWQPLIVIDGVGHFNRQLILNIEAIATLPELRTTLREQLRQVKGGSNLPRIKAAVGQATVDLIGGQPSEALLASLNLRSRPAPLTTLVSSQSVAELNRRAMSGPQAPEFILQHVQPPNDIIPTLENASVQLELYQHYDFVLEEDGLMLWRQKKDPSEIPAPHLVQSGDLILGETLNLPVNPKNTAYWLELDVRPNLLGRLWSCIDEINQPGLLLRDDKDHELHYALPASLASHGFLIAPFVRGEPDFLRLQTGTELPAISSLVVDVPAAGAWLWNKHVNYRLYSVKGINLGGNHLDAEVFQRFRLFNRVPIALAYYIPIKVLPYSTDAFIAFAHPDSSLEFAVTKQDRLVRASFGILDNAFHGENHTDGVDFSVEFIASDGLRQILFHRLLNPLVIPEDRGIQQLEVALPAGKPGRLLMRTYNPPSRNRSFDWSYWGTITIDSAGSANVN